MRNPDYLPLSDSELLIWFDNFKIKFAGYAPALGFSAADIAATNQDYDTLRYIIHTAEAIRNHSQGFTVYKKLLRDGPNGAPSPPEPSLQSLPKPSTTVGGGIVPRLRGIVARIKTRPAYNKAMGMDLGVIAAPVVKPGARAKPFGSATAHPNSVVRIDWNKGAFDAVVVEGQRAAETVWTRLGIDISSPYVDDRVPLAINQPEVRRYRLRYIASDVPTGDYSDTMTATTMP